MDSDKRVHVERELYYLRLESSNESSAEDGRSFRCETKDVKFVNTFSPKWTRLSLYGCSQTAENV